MVFQDLSVPDIEPFSSKKPPKPLASVNDRLIALVLDFLIFSPVISLLVAGLVKHSKTFFLLSSFSREGLIAAAMVFVVGIFFITLLQAVFLFFWQATPGQLFLQLRVISYPLDQERLSLNQCFVRAAFWSLSLVLMGLPFIEVVSHPLRRSLHERASDTLVITLKMVPDDGPMPVESRFISSWLRLGCLFLLLLLVVGFLKSYNSLLAGDYKEKIPMDLSVCKEMPPSDFFGTARLDAALSLFLLNEISPECLVKEADASLWEDPVHTQDLAYLAKYVVTDGKEQDSYFAKICEDQKSSLCTMAKYLKEDGSLQDIDAAGSKLWTTQLLISEERFSSADYVGSLKIIEGLQAIPELKNGLEKRFVRSVWALQFEHKKNRTRVPASAKDVDPSWLEKFKERYEVP